MIKKSGVSISLNTKQMSVSKYFLADKKIISCMKKI